MSRLFSFSMTSVVNCHWFFLVMCLLCPDGRTSVCGYPWCDTFEESILVVVFTELLISLVAFPDGIGLYLSYLDMIFALSYFPDQFLSSFFFASNYYGSSDCFFVWFAFVGKLLLLLNKKLLTTSKAISIFGKFSVSFLIKCNLANRASIVKYLKN